MCTMNRKLQTGKPGFMVVGQLAGHMLWASRIWLMPFVQLGPNKSSWLNRDQRVAREQEQVLTRMLSPRKVVGRRLALIPSMIQILCIHSTSIRVLLLLLKYWMRNGAQFSIIIPSFMVNGHCFQTGLVNLA